MHASVYLTYELLLPHACMHRACRYENILAQRLLRCADFLHGDLPPFVLKMNSSTSERLWRLTVASLQVAKALPLSARAYAAVHSIDALRKSWRIGLAGLFLKDELLSMLSSLKTLQDEATGRASLATLAGALYYSMADARKRRGDDPTAEARVHATHAPL